jgi:bifunctional non-homologous end joining protein LigD
VAFQRRKPAAIGVKAPLPGFIEPALATPIEKVLLIGVGSGRRSAS